MAVLFPNPKSQSQGTLLFPKPDRAPEKPKGSRLAALGEGALQTLESIPAGFNRLMTAGVNAVEKPLLSVPAYLNQKMTQGVNALTGNYFNLQPAGNPNIQLEAAGMPYDLSKAQSAQAHPYYFGGGEMLPYFIAPEARVLEGSSFVPSVVNAMATGGAYGGLSGASKSMKDALAGLLGGGATGGLVGGAFHAVPGAANLIGARLRKTSPLRPEVIAERLKNAEEVGIPVNAADLAKSPNYQMLYHDVLGSLPFSGIPEQNAQALQKSQDYANQVIDDLRGDSTPETVAHDVSNELRENFDTLDNFKRPIYRRLSEIADENKVQVNNENTRKWARNFLEREKRLPKEEKVNLPAEVLQDIKQAAASGKGEPSMSPFGAANLKLSDFEQGLREAQKAGNNRQVGIYKALVRNKKMDLENAVKDSDIPELHDAWKKADALLAQHYYPYINNKDIWNIVNGKVDEKTIPTILSKAKNEQILRHLKPETQKKVLFMKLQPALKEDENGMLTTTPMRLNNKYKSLNPAERERLSNPLIAQQFNNLKTIGELTSEARKTASLPPTGWRLTKNMMPGLALYGGLKALGASNPLATLSALGLTGTGRLGKKILSSQPILRATAGESVGLSPQMQQNALLLTKLLSGGINW